MYTLSKNPENPGSPDPTGNILASNLEDHCNGDHSIFQSQSPKNTNRHDLSLYNNSLERTTAPSVSPAAHTSATPPPPPDSTSHAPHFILAPIPTSAPTPAAPSVTPPPAVTTETIPPPIVGEKKANTQRIILQYVGKTQGFSDKVPKNLI
ncbi:hypothetical protein B0H14DRAFT_2560436 [Mycena olivaceomarginata]|nr:hypothetical protein B0H14DRAFT_2560436 [Mycena olivaceomarginata]